MKRIALLLAAVGLGSGCVVDTCDTGSLSVDWSFSSVNGATGLACSDIRLSSPIVDVDVFLDGSPVATFVNCYDYGVTIFDVSSGSHEVTVEGYDASGYIVTRDWFTTSVASCGDTFDVAMPGEGLIEFLPLICEAGTTYLTYELEDQFRAPYVLSAIYPTSLAYGDFTCMGGISFPVPFGYYALTGIEERNSAATLVYGAKCTPTYVDVLGSGVTSTVVDLAGTTACF
jgi:hypothetical protein